MTAAKKAAKARRVTARTAHPKKARAKKSAAAPAAPRPGSEEAREAETAAARAKFLDTYAKVGNVTAACELSTVGRRTHYNWLDTDPAYVKAFEDAKAEAVDRLEQEARRRALVGINEPVFGKLPGKDTGSGEIGRIRKYSDTLLIFLLNGHRPEVYKQRHEVTGKNGAPLNPPVRLDLSKLTTAELVALEGLVAKTAPAQEGA